MSKFYDTSISHSWDCTHCIKCLSLHSQCFFTLEMITQFISAVLAQDVYKRSIRPTVVGVIQGLNATIFAYGSTGRYTEYTRASHIPFLRSRGPLHFSDIGALISAIYCICSFHSISYFNKKEQLILLFF